jgi:hypothetical protein
MRKLYIITLLLLFTQAAFCQGNLFKQWDKRYGGLSTDPLTSILNVEDGYIIGGASYSSAGGDKSQNNWGTGSDFWVVKIDSNGMKVWDKRYGNSDGISTLYTMGKCADGSYLLAGSAGPSNDGDKTQTGWGFRDFWLIKIDPNGNKLWDKRFGGFDDDYVSSCVELNNSDILLTGRIESGMGGDISTQGFVNGITSDLWVLKLDSSGNIIWEKRFGGNAQETKPQIIALNDTSYILCASSSSTISGDRTAPLKGSTDVWVLGLDAGGNKMWDKSYGNSIAAKSQEMKKINDSTFVICAVTYMGNDGDVSEPGVGATDFWVLQLDKEGNKIKDFVIGGTDFEDDGNIDMTSDGFLVSGFSISNIGGDKSENSNGNTFTWVVKVDSVGSKIWDRTIFSTNSNIGFAINSGSECFIAAISTSDNIGGYKTQDSWNNSSDYWVVKFCEFPVGIDNAQPQNNITVSVYPNPFSDEIAITVKKQNLSDASFTLTNAKGQIIYTKEETNLSDTYTKTLDLHNLPAGVYFVEVTIGEEKVVRQVVKQ